MSARLIIFGSYLAVFCGVSVFDLPKLLCICLGAVLIPWKERTALRTPFFLLIGAALFSVAASETPIQGLLGHQGSATYGVLGMVAAWMAYEAGCGYAKDCSEMVLRAAGLCAIIAIAAIPLLSINHRALGSQGSPPYLACMLALAFPLTYHLTNTRRIFYGAILLAGIAASGSRAGIIGASAGVIWVLTPVRYRLYAILAPIGIISFGLVRAQGDALRLSIWPLAWQAFKTHPWLGVGPDNFGDFVMRFRDSSWPANPEHVADNAHCFPLHVLATQGLLGATEWLHLIVRAQMTPSVVAVLSYGLFNPIPFQAWCVLAFMWGSSKVALSKPESEVLAMKNAALGSSTR